jgi:TPP-dependent pyruvate/acetoin dehydrogenase alpha subunit
VRYKRWLLAKGLVAEAELTQIDRQNRAAVDASIEFARKSADPAPEAGVLNTYAKDAAQATQFYNRKGLASQPRLT